MTSRSQWMPALPEFVRPPLERAHLEQGLRRSKARTWQDLDLVIDRGDGAPLNPDTLSSRWRVFLARSGVQANDALDDLRDLARGIYPPLLADKGLGVALEAQARKAVVPTTVEAGDIGRFSQDVESAIYFSCLEALQNIGKYAEATSALIALSNGLGVLRFSVTDDGRGFDPTSTVYGTGLQGIADRLAAIGGEMQVRAAPGAGTTVQGQIPAEAQR